MTRKPTKPPVVDAVTVDRDPPPPSAPAAAIVLRLPGETREQSLARIRRQIAERTGKARGLDALPAGPYAARSHGADGILRSWLRSGAEVVWQEPDGSVSAGRWSAGPDLATAILAADGSLSRGALRMVSSWLASSVREAA